MNKTDCHTVPSHWESAGASRGNYKTTGTEKQDASERVDAIDGNKSKRVPALMLRNKRE